MRKHRKVRKVISEFVHCHLGKPATIIGGAPSRLTDVPLCPQNGIFISANDHGLLQRDCDYIAACEDLGIRLFQWERPIIASWSRADIRVFEVPLPNSAALGAWAAYVMGCAPVVIAGVECYQGKTYPQDPDLRTSGHKLTLKEHLLHWQKLDLLAPRGIFRAISGPLLSIFPRYSSAEFCLPKTDKDELIRRVSGSFVRFFQGQTLGDRTYPRGIPVQVSQIEERYIVRNGLGERVYA